MFGLIQLEGLCLVPQALPVDPWFSVGRCCPHRMLHSVRGTWAMVTAGVWGLLALRGRRPGRLLSALRGPGRPRPRGQSSPHVHSAEAEKACWDTADI